MTWPGPTWVRPKKVHGTKKSPIKNPTWQKNPQKFCRPGPAHELSLLNMKKIILFFKLDR